MNHLYQVRKELHKIPELAFQEVKTTEFILNYLSQIPNLHFHTFDFPGLLVEYSQGEEDFLLFRADMDALPIEEQTGSDFTSQHRGLMHACGHDIHMTALIGLIEHVTNNNLQKNLLFLFQPAEEGLGGAERVLASGILERFKIKEAYAMHVHPAYPIGTIISNDSVLLGIPQEFELIIRGKSSHAAHPHKGNDAITAAAHFQQQINGILQKSISPTDSYLMHIGRIDGGTARNIVAEKCIIEGTLRSFTKEVMQTLKTTTEETAKRIAALHQTEAEVIFLANYDPVVNSPRLFQKLKTVLPEELQLLRAEPVLLGEDFGFFTTKYEGLMFWVGAGTPEIDVHSPFFLPAEESILAGLKTFISLLEGEAGAEQKS